MSAVHLASAALPLARTSEGSKSGPIGLAIILLLIIACYFLFKSMSGHLRRVREGFPKNPPTPPTAATRAVPLKRTADGAALEPGTVPPDSPARPDDPDAPPAQS